MIRLNAKLIENPELALETMMSVTAAIYTGIDDNAPMYKAIEAMELCKSMWQVCDALRGLVGGVQQ